MKINLKKIRFMFVFFVFIKKNLNKVVFVMKNLIFIFNFMVRVIFLFLVWDFLNKCFYLAFGL